MGAANPHAGILPSTTTKYDEPLEGGTSGTVPKPPVAKPAAPPKVNTKGIALQAFGDAVGNIDFTPPPRSGSTGSSAYSHARPPLQERIQQVSRDIWKQQEADEGYR